MPNLQMNPKQTAAAAAIDRILIAFQTMMQGQMRHHATEVIEIDVTMAQAKAMYLLVAGGDLRMSALAGLLGVTSSTATGLVDRLVELDLAERHEDVHDRRQVVIRATPRAQAVLEHFRELNEAGMRQLLAYIEPDDLPVIERAVELMLGATERAASATSRDGDQPTQTRATADAATHPSDHPNRGEHP
jgi:DNA-binding MarR family transcriptional regulator